MAWTGDSIASYDAVGVSVLLSPVASPRAREPEFYYTLAFPNTRITGVAPSKQQQQQQRVSYHDTVAMLRSVTAGGKERERRAVDEFRCAWMSKFRCPSPAPHDMVPFALVQELLRELIVQRFDAVPGLVVAARMSADEKLLLLRFRPSRALLVTRADSLQLKVPVAPELDPGKLYWRGDPQRALRERTQWDRAAAQEELYRLFLAGKIPPDEAQLFDDESPAMWSRRIHALQRFADPQAVAAAAAAIQHHAPRSVSYSSRAALQYMYRVVEASGGENDTSPFRVVDKIRLTKAIVDAEFDCDALVAQHILTHHLCAHTYHTDAVDTSIDVLRAQWGCLVSPWRVARQRLAPLTSVLHFQPLLHVRNYFGEEIALYFAYTSFYAQAMQCLSGGVLLLALLQLWLYDDATTRNDDGSSDIAAMPSYIAIGFCLVNCAFVQVVVRKWTMRQRVLASEWSVVTASKNDSHARPQFRGELTRSAVNLRLEPHYPPALRNVKRMTSYALLTVLSATLLILYHALLTTSAFDPTAFGTDDDSSFAGLDRASVLLAVVTKCVAVPLTHVCRYLNDWENYKTQSDYDANLTLKFALLHTVNGFGVLWYLTFLRPFVSADACNAAAVGRSCHEQAAALLCAMLTLELALTLYELRAPLFALFAATNGHRNVRDKLRPAEVDTLRLPTRQTAATAAAATAPHASSVRQTLLRRTHHTHTTPTTRAASTVAQHPTDAFEAELALEPYEGVMLDYGQVILSFVYVTWFAALAPVSCVLLAWTNAVLQIRVDTFKLSHATQRPFPKQSNSIGSWLLYLRFLSLSSLLHNAALAWMVWMDTLAPQHPVQLHELVTANDADALTTEVLLTSESGALAVFAAFALMWVVAGLPDARDRSATKQLQHAREAERFLERKYLRSIDRIADAARDALPPGRVFLNGVHQYVVTGNRSEEDAADEIYDELQRRQLRVLDVDTRIAELRRTNANVGVLVVEVERISILPIMDTLTKAVDSFVRLQLEAAATDSGDDSNNGNKPVKTAATANTSVVKKNRSPQWHEKFEFPVTTLNESLALSVWDWELLGKNRRIGRAPSLLVADIVTRTQAGAETESPTRQRMRSASSAATPAGVGGTTTTSNILVFGSFELPIELPESLRSSLTHTELARHGPPRLMLRCGVQLTELGVLLVQRRRLQSQIESLRTREVRFSQWTA